MANKLEPEDIEKVTAILHTVCVQTKSPEGSVTEEDFPWNTAYLVACTAHGINRSRWHESDVLQDPKIRKFMQRVEHTFADLGERGKDLRDTDMEFYEVTGAEILAKGKTCREVGYCEGGVCEIRKVSDEEVINKFINNVSGVLPLDRANKVVQTVLELEKLENAAELMGMITP